MKCLQNGWDEVVGTQNATCRKKIENGINSRRQAAFTTLLGKLKYQSIGVLVNTQLGLSGDVDDLKKMRCSQNEWCGMV